MNSLLERLSRKALPWDVALVTDGLGREGAQTVAAAVPAAPEKVRIMIDHDTPAGSVAAAEVQKKLLDFSRERGIEYCCGQGIGYHLLMERGLSAGEIVICGGRHAATVGAVGAVGLCLSPAELKEALETDVVSLDGAPLLGVHLAGELSPCVTARDLALTMAASGRYAGALVAIRGSQLTVSQRADVCGLLAAAGARSAFFGEEIPADETVDLSGVQHMAVLPGDIHQIVPAGSIGGIRVNQVFIGGCAGGTLEALRLTAEIWRGRKVCPYVRVMVAPATASVYVQALDEGVIDVFLDAGALVMNQGCSACWAQSQGRCDGREVFATTGSINCAGWAGKNHNGIYLVSVRTAAQAALSGSIYEN